MDNKIRNFILTQTDFIAEFFYEKLSKRYIMDYGEFCLVNNREGKISTTLIFKDFNDENEYAIEIYDDLVVFGSLLTSNEDEQLSKILKRKFNCYDILCI